MFLVDYDDMSFTMEAYYGKTKELKEIEKELELIINQINEWTYTSADKIKYDNKLKNISNSQHVQKVEKLFIDMFKLENFYLSLYTAFPFGVFARIQNNAFTFPMAFNFFRPKINKNRVDSTGMIFGVNIDIGLIRHANLNAEELLAIILHEVGHNMNASVLNFLSKNLLQMLLDICRFPAMYGEINKSIDNVLDESPRAKKFLTIIMDLLENINIFFRSINGISYDAIIAYLSNPTRLIRLLSFDNIFGYADEKYSDSFATAYGYGPALSSALNKLDKLEGYGANKTINKVPVLNWYRDFNKTLWVIISGAFDPHPHTPARIAAQLHKLKKDINDPNLDPRVKKEIQKDIDTLENFINNEYLNIQKNSNISRIFTWMTNYITIKVFKGRVDIRELFDKLDYME